MLSSNVSVALPGKSIYNGSMIFEIDKLITIVPGGKAFINFCFVLSDSTSQVVSHTDIQHGLNLIRQNIDIAGSHDKILIGHLFTTGFPASLK